MQKNNTVKIDEALIEVLHKRKSEYVSGEELAQKLNVSRTAIWNHITHLRQCGYVIDAVSNTGYRLVNIPDKMLPDEIMRLLCTKIIGRNVVSFEETASTSSVALRMAEDGEPEGTIVIAESQNKGRGRHGRCWSSPKGKGLWFSLILRPDISPQDISQITCAGAIACARAITDISGCETEIKWPNDIIVGGKKISGILTEINSDLEGIRYVVLGVGINVNVDKTDFPKEIRNIATSMKIELSKNVSRLSVLGSFLQWFEEYYLELQSGKFDRIRTDWISLSNTIGKYVTVETQGKKIEGYATGVDPKGNLVVRLPNGLNEYVMSGDVTVQ
ncbi:MAG: biotin--[acetyl-CoA-carboxylase] ligase [Candidatus Ancaeobacter aquaticus]|nr:biotin--[acetyl-CoA-carboxylase] ligase [Candidatus Ancaeobacter aquaticus]